MKSKLVHESIYMFNDKQILMKKLTLLGALLCATAMQAQTTYYWPGTRVTTLESEKSYFIYNTAYDKSSTPNDRGSFLYAQESGNFGTLDPKQYANAFVTTNGAYLFTFTHKDGNIY